MMTPQQLSQFIREHFTHSAYRWERQPAYEVASDGSDYKRYLDGQQEPSWERLTPWLDQLRNERTQHDRAGTPGRYRVRLFHQPVTDYERYEAEWGYELTSAAGERIYVLDPAEHQLPAVMLDHDYWLLDDTHAVRMHYASDGQFLGATVEPELVESYRQARAAAMRCAEPFQLWWARHPEHKRNARRKAA